MQEVAVYVPPLEQRAHRSIDWFVRYRLRTRGRWLSTARERIKRARAEWRDSATECGPLATLIYAGITEVQIRYWTDTSADMREWRVLFDEITYVSYQMEQNKKIMIAAGGAIFSAGELAAIRRAGDLLYDLVTLIARHTKAMNTADAP